MKTFVCRCEDITVADCQEAMREGYAAFEDLKRFLGLATGPCQGKACVAAAIGLIAEERGIRADEVDVMTFRPPVRPVPLGVLAAQDDEAGGQEDAGDQTAPAPDDNQGPDPVRDAHAARPGSAGRRPEAPGRGEEE